MDGWLKRLIAAACCAVIAGGGFLAWDQYERHSAAQTEAKQALLHRCHVVIAEFDKRSEGTPVPAALSGDRVIETASDDEIRLRLKSCAEQIPEFAGDISRLLERRSK